MLSTALMFIHVNVQTKSVKKHPGGCSFITIYFESGFCDTYTVYGYEPELPPFWL